MLHIIRNLLAGFKTFTHNHKALVWTLQGAKWEEHYESTLTIIQKECGGDVERYLRSIPVER